MDNYSKIYWLTRLDSIHKFFSIFVGLCMAVLIIYHLVLFVNSDIWDEDESKEYKKNWEKYKMGCRKDINNQKQTICINLKAAILRKMARRIL